jgi:Holliday junction resolvase RusA-like endonuclease
MPYADWTHILIPGDPVAQGRPRFYPVGKPGKQHMAAVDPPKSKRWKAHAQDHMRSEVDQPADRLDPIRLELMAVFACPKSDYRKRTPRPRRSHTKRPDIDNVLKAVLDAGTGVLWIDDDQVCEVHARKIIGAQDEAPRVELSYAVILPEELP